MNKIRFGLKTFVFVVFTIACATAAQAQATRTWVSGVGDDVNPCSRTAPCKTFAGAISKTADNGEIDALDPGGFGTVTITKSITIDGTTGQGFGSILAAGTTGVVVNDSLTAAPMSEIVRLRNLSINGATTGTIGVNYVSAKALYIENCIIANFRGGTGQGIRVNHTANGGEVHVRDTIVSNTLNQGVFVTTSTGQVKTTFDNVRVDKSSVGFHISNNASVYMVNCVSTLNTSHGYQFENNTSANMDHSAAFGNGGNGLNAGAGASSVRISDVSILNNLGGGVVIAGGTVFSFGDNKIRGNGGVGDISGGALNNTTTKQ
ncbi:MAG TPA: right-handed parallel beta-helix repeat-containing protein [Pyrinomonadaceae bacterium]|nr:right-handed parallel beta-helix repeat-containing protein [Pyrinomonadaceae bacterium]